MRQFSEHPCHSHSVLHELMVHLPYAVFSVAFGMALLSFTSFYTMGVTSPDTVRAGSDVLFHCFHFMHLVFAATGTVITFFRFSKSILGSVIVGTFSPIVFCMLSDAILPYIGGRMLGVSMTLHLCFLTEIYNVIPFLLVGLINGLVLSCHRASLLPMYSIFSHVIHILVSSLASTFYLISHGFIRWYDDIGFVFLFLIVAVVLPCTLSDLVVPMLFAKANNEHKKH